MEASSALRAFAALSQPSRLAVLRLLVKAVPAPMAAGDIARQLTLRPNTLSTHLTLLTAAGLIHAQRQGRSILYAADMTGLNALIGFLVQDCCGGHPDLCPPFAKVESPCPITSCSCAPAIPPAPSSPKPS